MVLPFLALVPLGVWVGRLPSGTAGGQASVSGGALLGAIHFGLTFHWVPVALVVADPGLGSVAFALAAFALIVVGLAALTAVSVRLLHHAVHAFGAPLWLALAVMWTALEWSRAHLPDSLALPWLGLGTSLTAHPELVGIAEIVGARGVTFWLGTVNGLLAMLWLRRTAEDADRNRRRALLAAATALVVVAPAAWGVWRASTLGTREAAHIAVVQPNMAGRAKVPAGPSMVPDPTMVLPPPGVLGGSAADDRAVARGPEAAVDAPARPVDHTFDDGPVDLVVLPELFVRGVPGSPEASAAVDALQAYSGRVGAPVLFGGLGAAEDRGSVAEDGVADAAGASEDGEDAPGDPGNRRVRYNSAFLVTPDGLSDFRYDKHRLVPVVERVPFRPPGIRNGRQGSGAYASGTGWPLADVDGVRYGVLICYESSYPEVARALRRAGADVLVNLTNDAWFGQDPWYARTTALWQHPAHLVMRAIESRVGVVRSANTGISLFVDPVGRRHEVTELFTEDARRYRVHSTDLTTVYVRLGDVAGNVCALVAFGLLLGVTWGPRGRAWKGVEGVQRAARRDL